MKLRDTILFAVAAGVVVAPVAAAHVTVNPSRAPAGSLTRFQILVPTEEDVPTVKVTVQLAAGLEEVTFQPKSGWKRSVKSAQGRTVVTWSGGEIGPEEFDEFALSAELPKTAGEELLFPTLQTYANGKVVRWIEAPSGEFPAPRVTLEAAQNETSTTASTTTSATSGYSGDDHDELAIGLAIAGLAAGLLALGLTLVRRRRA